MTDLYGPAHGLTRYDLLQKAVLEETGPAKPLPQVFGSVFGKTPLSLGQTLTHEKLLGAYDALVGKMGEVPDAAGPADAGMTFFGQFVDHDVTLDATSSLGRRIDPDQIRNVRTPSLDLDCVYGDGPEASPHLYGARVDAAHNYEHFLVFGTGANPLDLARTAAGKALIGDPRNDENLVVGAVQGLFIRLHNILMHYAEAAAKEAAADDEGAMAADVKGCAHMGMDPDVWDAKVKPAMIGFEEVRRFIRLHYQWIVWNEFLPGFVDQDCLDAAARGLPIAPGAPEMPVMPIEFSGAAYRFGHVTVRDSYDLNAARQGVDFSQLLGFGHRGADKIADLRLFFGETAQNARPVGMHIAKGLLDLPFVHAGTPLRDGAALTRAQARKLPLRNIVRDRYVFELSDGHGAAAAMHIPAAKRPAVPAALSAIGVSRTPLWVYCMQEAEQFGHGKLTGVGGRMVATVFRNLLLRDASSFWHMVPGFEPWHGFRGHGSVLAGIVDFVESRWDGLPQDLRDALKSG